MLICSSHRDYYDTASAYGIDKTCVYNRKEEALEGKFNIPDHPYGGRWPFEESFFKKKSKYDVVYVFYKYVIGFCGNLYPVIISDKITKSAGTTERYAFYNQEDLNKFTVDEKIDLKNRKSYWNNRDFYIDSESSMKLFFDPKSFKGLEEEFYKNRAPVFIYGRFPLLGRLEKLVLNPILRQYKFMKVKDPQTAFQDIFMYQSGVLGTTPEKPKPVDDKIMAAARGHDGEFSFRKPPGTKRSKPKWR